MSTIASLEELLADPAKILAEVKSETQKLKKDYGDARRTVIDPQELGGQTDEEFVTHQDMVVTLSQRGYIKRVPCDTYRTQHRGGKGVRGMTTREDDALLDLVVVDTHDTLLFFSNRGRVYPLRVFRIPGEASRTARGTLLVNLIPLSQGEQVQAILPVENPREEDLLILATRLGEVKALRRGQLSNIQNRGADRYGPGAGRRAGRRSPIGRCAGRSDDIGQRAGHPLLRGRPEAPLPGRRRSPGNAAAGWRHHNRHEHHLTKGPLIGGKRRWVWQANGHVPLSPTYQGRAGVRTFRVTDKTGPVAAARVVEDLAGQEIFIISAKAQVVRINLEDVRVAGRNTSGVIVWRDREPDDFVASVACIPETDYSPKKPSDNGHDPDEDVPGS